MSLAYRPAALALTLLLGACGEAEKPAETPPPPAAEPKAAAPAVYDLAARAKDLNVILISMDALRYDRTGLDGNTDGLTPNLDAFAKEAYVFHETTAAAPWTVPSHMAVWTGRWPTHHGVVNKLAPGPDGQLVDAKLADGIETYPQKLVEGGWKAAAFTGGAGVSAKFGYDRGGFDKYVDDQRFAGFDYSIPLANAWLEANKDQRFFLFLHGYDAHGQHDVLDMKAKDVWPEYAGKLDGSLEEQAKLREQGLAAIQAPGQPADLTGVLDANDATFLFKLYDQKVKEADKRLAGFLAKVKELGLYENSVIILFSDHGDEFMEHGYLDHGATLCEHQLHTVMLMHFPGQAERVDIQTPVRSIDLFPTLFESLGLQGPAEVDGKSLLPLLRGEQAEYPVFAESDYRLFVHQRMARRGSQKLILDLEDGEKQLFDLATDREETKDLSGADARATYEIEQSLRAWMGANRTDPATYLGLKDEPIKIF